MPPPQFSLKWLLGLVFWLAILCGWLTFLHNMEQSPERLHPVTQDDGQK